MQFQWLQLANHKGCNYLGQHGPEVHLQFRIIGTRWVFNMFLLNIKHQIEKKNLCVLFIFYCQAQDLMIFDCVQTPECDDADSQMCGNGGRSPVSIAWQG